MISIIIPTYNDERTLASAVQSICNQTTNDWECVVVDDGSRLPATDVLEGFSDRRIRVIGHSENRGRGAARLTGLQNTTGEFIAWQDADDFSHPERLERQLRVMHRYPDLAFVGTGAFATDGFRCLGVTEFGDSGPRSLGPFEDPPVVHASLMFRRSVLDSVRYREELTTAEDYDFLTRALQVHQFANIDCPLYAYRYPGEISLRKYWESQRVRASLAVRSGRSSVRSRFRAFAYYVRFVPFAALNALGRVDLLLLRSYARPNQSDHEAFRSVMESIHPPVH